MVVINSPSYVKCQGHRDGTLLFGQCTPDKNVVYVSDVMPRQ